MKPFIGKVWGPFSPSHAVKVRIVNYFFKIKG